MSQSHCLQVYRPAFPRNHAADASTAPTCAATLECQLSPLMARTPPFRCRPIMEIRTGPRYISRKTSPIMRSSLPGPPLAARLKARVRTQSLERRGCAHDPKATFVARQITRIMTKLFGFKTRRLSRGEFHRGSRGHGQRCSPSTNAPNSRAAGLIAFPAGNSTFNCMEPMCHSGKRRTREPSSSSRLTASVAE
jgi:hypothetical protein